MKQETYKAARARLLTELAARGWTTRPALKVPWAEPSAWKPDYRVWFRAQAVYLNAHSLWIDIRGMTIDDFTARVQAVYDVRRAH